MHENKPWNLSPEQWSTVLKTKDAAQRSAQDILEGKMLPWVHALLANTGPDDKVLDLGSGAGQNSAFLARQGRDTTLLDWSKENMDFSNELFGLLGINGMFIERDMTKPLPFSDKFFDTVFSCGVFEYFSDATINDILKEAFRVAKKRVIIMVPNAASVPYRLGMWYLKKTNQWQWGGERPYRTMKPYFNRIGDFRVREFTVGTKHSLNFLKMPAGPAVRKTLVSLLRLKDHPGPSIFNQGYLLVSIAEKDG